MATPAEDLAKEWDEVRPIPEPHEVHGSVPDGLALIVKLEESGTPMGLLAPAVALLAKDPRADPAAVYAAMLDGGVGLGTVRKARCLLLTGLPAPAAVSAHPLDAIRVLRGEMPAHPLHDPGAADRSAVKAAAAERDAERARADALLARLEEAAARAAADAHRIAGMEAQARHQAELLTGLDAATAPAGG